MEHKTGLTQNRSLFPSKKKILAGALAITSLKTDKTYEFHDIHPIDVWDEYPPMQARWVYSQK